MATCDQLLGFLNTMEQTVRTQKNREAIVCARKIVLDKEFSNAQELHSLLQEEPLKSSKILRVLNILAVYKGLDVHIVICGACNKQVAQSNFCKHCGNKLKQ